MSEPNVFEQYDLELINAERALAGVQPLVFNFQLDDAAELHSQWMIATDTFSHTGSGGSSATQRMTASGYALSGSWATGENIAWASLRAPAGYQDEVLLLHANLMTSTGHRENILNANFREVGIGFEVGEYQGWQGAFVTQDFGKTGTATYLTGVAIDDLDGDRFYDTGEGLGGLTVTAVGAGGATYSTTTYGSGGYALALPNGTYTVTFSGGGFAASSQQATVSGRNVKLDLVDPQAGQAPVAGVMRGGSGPDTITGGGGDDTIEGGDGVSYLRGGDGADRMTGGRDFDDINGNMGNDTEFGGDGDDWVAGGKDNDALYGENGSDVVYGNMGADTCDGGAGADIVRGGQGDDILRGGAGDDWLSGDRDSDTISGGGGGDTFHISPGAGLDRILDFSRAEGDRVMLDLGTTYAVAQSGADVVITIAGADQMILVGVSMSSLTGDWIFGA
ncbi:CAP domain-containing protein [Phenylobacterium sp.]|uniref:CAP domain-containing protein n=1 Tax=Phenylobacterium sp. TaxID=1871053 RepID=UPI0027351BF9|nr:CAP domain-containing protein [Phenylobacterium sp.]MDP3659426.1 CAP domain-containing protein [Phenylobacterium sp.]